MIVVAVEYEPRDRAVERNHVHRRIERFPPSLDAILVTLLDETMLLQGQPVAVLLELEHLQYLASLVRQIGIPAPDVDALLNLPVVAVLGL